MSASLINGNRSRKGLVNRLLSRARAGDSIPRDFSSIGVHFALLPAVLSQLHSLRFRAPARRLRHPVPLFVKSSFPPLVPKGDLLLRWMARRRLLQPLEQALARPILWAGRAISC